MQQPDHPNGPARATKPDAECLRERLLARVRRGRVAAPSARLEAEGEITTFVAAGDGAARCPPARPKLSP